MRACLLAVILNLGLVLINAQNEYKPSKEIYSQALSLAMEGMFDRAYDELIKINYNDTAYYEAMSFALALLEEIERYDTIQHVCEKVLSLDRPNGKKAVFYEGLGKSYNHKEKWGKAIKLLDKAIQEFPTNGKLYVVLSDTYYGMKDYDKCLELLQKAIRYNPTDYHAHFKLGKLCAEADLPSKAAMSFNMAIWIAAENNSSIDGIIALQDVYNNSINKEQGDIKLNFREKEDFSLTDNFILNQVAADSKYKVKKMKLNYPFIKHNHLLFDKLYFDESSNSFWNQTYVKFYKQVIDNDEFNNFSYYQCMSVNDARTQKIITSQKKQISNFVSWSGALFIVDMNERMIWNGDSYDRNTFNHDFEYGIGSIGPLKDHNPIGDYIGFDGNGNIVVEGKYNSESKRNGDFTFYDDHGRKQFDIQYVDGTMEGYRKEYFETGYLRSELYLKDGVLVDSAFNFYPYGMLYNKIPIKKGKKNGVVEYFYGSGELHKKITYLDDKLDGPYEEYHRNGQLVAKFDYKDGQPLGEYIVYYSNGEKMYEKAYKDGKLNGIYKSYYNNGQLEQEGEYQEGIMSGVWKSYSRKGVLTEEANYGATGKKTGKFKQYDLDGNLELELNYEGEDIVGYKSYNDKGEILSEGTISKKRLNVEIMHSTGELSSKGQFFKGEKVGRWEYYNERGILISFENFNDQGVLHGEGKEYFENGLLEMEYTYENGLRQGYFVEYYSNGEVFREGNLEGGNYVGEWLFYYPNGSMKTKMYYLDGENQGEIIYYNEIGDIEEKALYYYGTLQTVIQVDSTGSETKFNLDKGKANFEFKYVNGKVKNEKSYSGCRSHGKVLTYHENGKISSEGIYEYGNKVGDWKGYYENGVLSYEGAYLEGERHGMWKWYHENGNLKSEGTYDFGSLDGVKKWFYENGKLEAQKTYRNNKRHGKCIYYDESGKIRYYRYYNDGVMLGYSYNGRDGKESEMISFMDEDGKIVAYYPAGAKSYESEYKNGFNEGLTVNYHPNGKVMSTVNFRNGKEHGVSKVYFSNGNIKSEVNYYHGRLNGELKEYHENGKLKKISNYTMDSKFGWEETYDNKTQLIKRVYYYNDEIIK